MESYKRLRESYDESEFRDWDTTGIGNHGYDGHGEIATNAEQTKPHLTPAMNNSTQKDHFDQTPVYMNQLSTSPVSDGSIIPCHRKNSPRKLSAEKVKGTELKQLYATPKDSTSYISCNNALPTSTASDVITKTSQDSQPTDEGYGDKYGYARPIEVFNAVDSADEKSCDVKELYSSVNKFKSDGEERNQCVQHNEIARTFQDSQIKDESCDDRGGYVRPTSVFNTIEEESCGRKEVYTPVNKFKPESEEGYMRVQNNGVKDTEYVSGDDGYIKASEAAESYDRTTVAPGTNVSLRSPATNLDKTGNETEGLSSLPLAASTVTAVALAVPGCYRDRTSTNVEQHYEELDVYANMKRQAMTKQKGPSKQPTVSKSSKRARAVPPKRVMVSCIERSNSSSTRSPISDSTNIAYDNPHPYNDIDTINALESKGNGKEKGKGRGKEKKRNKKDCCILVSALVTLFFLCSVSLGISITMLTMQTMNSKDGTGNFSSQNEASPYVLYKVNSSSQIPAVDSIVDIHTETHRLKKEMAALRYSMEAQIVELKNKLDSALTVQAAMSQNINGIRNDLRTQTLVDLKSCALKSAVYKFASPDELLAVTEFKPSEVELKDHFSLFAFCTFSEASSLKLERKGEQPDVRYRCICTASEKTSTDKSCTIHYWICPRG